MSLLHQMYPNNLLLLNAQNRVCTALGIKLVNSPAIIQIAAQAKYDSVFIDLEHSTLSLNDASTLCTSALSHGLTPFVRVPHQCGTGFVQRVLDGGAMGVIFPHINSRKDALDAVRMCKYPPVGSRSLTAQLPQFGLVPTPGSTIIKESNAKGSSVFLMIESTEGLANVDEIAATPGADVLLLGSNDLTVELGIPGRFDEAVFQDALDKISDAAERHKKIFGIAGLYHRKDILDRAISRLNDRYLLAGVDAALLMAAAVQNVVSVKAIQDGSGMYS